MPLASRGSTSEGSSGSSRIPMARKLKLSSGNETQSQKLLKSTGLVSPSKFGKVGLRGTGSGGGSGFGGGAGFATSNVTLGDKNVTLGLTGSSNNTNSAALLNAYNNNYTTTDNNINTGNPYSSTSNLTSVISPRTGVFVTSPAARAAAAASIAQRNGSEVGNQDEGPDKGERSNLALLKQRMNMEKEVSFTGLRRQAGLVGKDKRLRDLEETLAQRTSAYSSEIEVMQLQLDSSNQQANNLQSYQQALADSHAQREALEQKFMDYIQSHQSLESEHRQQRFEHQTELEGIVADNNLLRPALEAAEDQVRRMKIEQKTEHASTIGFGALRDELRDLKRILTAEREQLKLERATRAEAEQCYEQLLHDADHGAKELAKQAGTVAGEKKALQKQILELARMFDHQKQKLRQWPEERDELRAELAEAQATTSQLNITKTLYTEAKTMLAKMEIQLQSERDQTSYLRTTFDHNVAQYTDEKRRLIQEKMETHDTIRELEKRMANYIDQAKDAEHEKHMALAELTECQQKLLVLKDIEEFHQQTVENNEVTNRANKELQVTLESTRRAFDEHRLSQEKKYEALEQDNGDLKKLLQELQPEFHRLQTESERRAFEAKQKEVKDETQMSVDKALIDQLKGRVADRDYELDLLRTSKKNLEERFLRQSGKIWEQIHKKTGTLGPYADSGEYFDAITSGQEQGASQDTTFNTSARLRLMGRRSGAGSNTVTNSARGRGSPGGGNTNRSGNESGRGGRGNINSSASSNRNLLEVPLPASPGGTRDARTLDEDGFAKHNIRPSPTYASNNNMGGAGHNMGSNNNPSNSNIGGPGGFGNNPMNTNSNMGGNNVGGGFGFSNNNMLGNNNMMGNNNLNSNTGLTSPLGNFGSFPNSPFTGTEGLHNNAMSQMPNDRMTTPVAGPGDANFNANNNFNEGNNNMNNNFNGNHGMNGMNNNFKGNGNSGHGGGNYGNHGNNAGGYGFTPDNRNNNMPNGYGNSQNPSNRQGRNQFGGSAGNHNPNQRQKQRQNQNNNSNQAPKYSYHVHKGDDIDELLAAYIETKSPALPFYRLSEGLYLYGSRKTNCKLNPSIPGKLLFRVGGGWCDFDEFVGKYS